VIVADSSVWIDHLNSRATLQVESLRDLLAREQILVGDLILLEILQGVRSERDAEEMASLLRQFPFATMLDADLAVSAAANYRFLRARGVTIRKTADLIIGTFCLQNDHLLLHNDRDFDAFAAHLGLRIVDASLPSRLH